MTPLYHRYAPIERLEGPGDAPECADDHVCPNCHQFYWFCQGHPKPEAAK